MRLRDARTHADIHIHVHEINKRTAHRLTCVSWNSLQLLPARRKARSDVSESWDGTHELRNARQEVQEGPPHAHAGQP